MSKKNYAEKLLDPRWQKKRLEVLERDKFKCQGCYSVDKTLHVHHSFYRKGAEPWEYDARDLITFCHACHLDAEKRRERILKMTRFRCDQISAERFLDAGAGNTYVDLFHAHSSFCSILADAEQFRTEKDSMSDDDATDLITSVRKSILDLTGNLIQLAEQMQKIHYGESE